MTGLGATLGVRCGGDAEGGDGDKIIYTHTDEAPMLATYSLLPIIKTFTLSAGLPVELRDISVAARILCLFPECLKEDQRVPDDLTELGKLAKSGKANIIKLPNISASAPQLAEAVAELRGQGFNIPEYPNSDPAITARYAGVLGSAVNPVLREGNSDRRVADAVKKYAQKNPHKMGAWKNDAKTHVSCMDDGDYYGSEKAVTMDADDELSIVFKGEGGEKTLKTGIKVLAGEIVDSSRMSASKLRAFYQAQIDDAKSKDILLSLHLKATMMKISDPIYFGHMVSVYYKDALEKHADALKTIGFNPNNGIGDLYAKLDSLPAEKQTEIKADIDAVYAKNPRLAMVDSDKGITNLHCPSDVIIDASMPVVVRDSGCMWNRDNKLEEVKCVIPDRCYATMYDAVLDDCRKNGQFNVSTMGNVPNVGLMAQKAEEYGSHDKTFEMEGPGIVEVRDKSGKVLMTQEVETKDVFRCCQVKDAPIKDWVKLSCNRGKATGNPAVFWLDEKRAHDSELIKKVNAYLPEFKGSVDIKILAPVDAVNFSMERARRGENTISCTGNVLRDYLTDLFPILELGTSAKMLSIVPMLAGGGMYETGAGGSAPKHVQQFTAEGHLRWDSLGEFLALAVSLEDLAEKLNNNRARCLAKALNKASELWLDNRKAPSRKGKEMDNRGSHFWLCYYWAQAVSEQDEDAELKEKFTNFFKDMDVAKDKILQEMVDCQGPAVDIAGYYRPDPTKTSQAMRPSATFNAILEKY